MTEGIYEINFETYLKLSEDEELLNNFGYKVACNSMFKPYSYGYFGSRLRMENNKYYLIWRRHEYEYI